MRSGGTFDYAGKAERLTEVLRELEDPAVWQNPERAQELGRERGKLDGVVATLDKMTGGLDEAAELLDMAEADADEGMVRSVEQDLGGIDAQLAKLEFKRMFPGEMDSHNAFLDIQAGAGGTEAQDWANMLMRMYLRWGDKNGFKTEVVDANGGEVAGIKSATTSVLNPFLSPQRRYMRISICAQSWASVPPAPAWMSRNALCASISPGNMRLNSSVASSPSTRPGPARPSAPWPRRRRPRPCRAVRRPRSGRGHAVERADHASSLVRSRPSSCARSGFDQTAGSSSSRRTSVRRSRLAHVVKGTP